MAGLFSTERGMERECRRGNGSRDSAHDAWRRRKSDAGGRELFSCIHFGMDDARQLVVEFDTKNGKLNKGMKALSIVIGLVAFLVAGGRCAGQAAPLSNAPI